MSPETTTALFTSLGYRTPKRRTNDKIGNKLIPFHPSLRNVESRVTWLCQRDSTQLFNDFVRQAWSIFKRLFYVPHFQLVTMDDEIMGTRSAYNQVKALLDLKADRKVYASHIVGDGLFPYISDSCFRQRDEPHVKHVSRLLMSLT